MRLPFGKILDVFDRILRIIEKYLNRRSKKKSPKDEDKQDTSPKVHPWRKCPVGQYWVRAHPMVRTKGRRGHCRTNPSRKDQIHADEIEIIADEYFKKLKGPPAADDLTSPLGNAYDHLIRGWTKYWNDIFKPKDPLDADFVKALMATESSFREKIEEYAGKEAGMARGLMQVTDQTREILQDRKGELRDHLVVVTKDDLKKANPNIAAGIRWLFRKREIADAILKEESSWIKTVILYKGYWKEYKKGKEIRAIKKLNKLYERLKSYEKTKMN